MKCAIFLAEGFEPCEGLITIDMLKRAKTQIDIVTIEKDLAVRSSQRKNGMTLTRKSMMS